MAFVCSSTSLNLVPLMVPLSFGNKKVTGSQIRGLLHPKIHNSNVILARNSRMLKALCDGVLS